MADASIFIMKLKKLKYQKHIQPNLSHINIGTGKDITIMEVAKLIKEIVGFNGELFFDISKPEGPPKKFVDTARMKSYGWSSSTQLNEGLSSTYEWYSSQRNL